VRLGASFGSSAAEMPDAHSCARSSMRTCRQQQQQQKALTRMQDNAFKANIFLLLFLH
jgi:hypothetical protein